MAESLPHHHEAHGHESPKQKESLENYSAQPESARAPARNKEAARQKTEKLGELSRKIEHIASSSKEITANQKHESPPQHTAPAGTELKRHMLERTLVRTRKQLSSPERLLSKVVHQPAIDRLSTAGAKTVARPVGLLAGGICAFLGTSIFLFLAKQYGIPYNWLMLTLLFAAGYIVGSFIELFFRLYRRTRRTTGE